ncbi:ferredoxin family protein [Thermanaerosceptrum fracticalcis]|jgi:ferredoxin like protein|uniref:Ferredoxin family protein n=1 Tax=Thermanaerosceptrum fracticalcis TaxID=1712410 RepID=A0A7G6E3T3_THEFR|nr:ferredoxin family protein [Thermanaerosceptrum fracticalcis]QNB46737.1 ferredoxin family protein [Thermanaerosceptrum fracticalcis]
MKKLSIEERLGFNKYNVDDGKPHIILNKEICAKCIKKPCTMVCPAALYTEENGELKFDYAGCLECGTCRVICPCPGAIKWDYPQGSFGINFRYG